MMAANDLNGEKCKSDVRTPVFCNNYLRLPEGKKKAEYVHKCEDEKSCKVGKMVQLNKHLSKGDDGKFWRSCYGRIDKVGKSLFGSPKYLVELICTKKMLREGNDCCWPSTGREGPRHVWVNPMQFRLK